MTAGTGGTLYVVGTPIGNLADITLRAIELLGAVPLIAAEDTRVSRRLLVRHGIDTRMVSYHAQSGPERTAALLDHLRGGADLALVTDAGTPGVSDPGSDLVASWAAEGGQVVPVPGPSAVIAAVAASGLVGPRWGFEGFLPRRGRERRERLAAIGADPRGTILFEAPGRVASTLRDLAAACGVGRPAAIARELTKVHEQIVRGSLGQLVAAVADGTIPARGEFVLIIGTSDTGGPVPDDAPALEAARAAVERLIETGIGRAEAARRVAAETGLTRRQLYGSAARGRETWPLD